MRQIPPSSSAIANLTTATDYAQHYILGITGLAIGCTIPSATIIGCLASAIANLTISPGYAQHHSVGWAIFSAIANPPTATDYAQQCFLAIGLAIGGTIIGLATIIIGAIANLTTATDYAQRCIFWPSSAWRPSPSAATAN